MDYNALADAKVNLLSFRDALATDIGIRPGTMTPCWQT
jgi:uncharacterized membrane protein